MCFSGWSEKQDGRPGLWLAETFSTSPLKPLNGIQRNLTGNKIWTSSTKFFFQADRKNKMAVLAPDWLRHFRLLLWNRWTACNETWQEERSQRPLSSLCFLGRSEKLDGRPGQSVKKVAYCTQVHDMWPFGPLFFLKLCCYLHNNHQVYIGVSLRTFSPLMFLKLLAHLCAVTFMTEISSTVMKTTNKQINLLLTFVGHCELSCDLENDFVLNKVFQVLMSPGT